MPTPRRPKPLGNIIIIYIYSRSTFHLPPSLPPSHFSPRVGLGRIERKEQMESPISEDKLNARRKAVVLNGFPLLALAFQTLGVCSLRSFQPHTITSSHTPFRHYLLRYWHRQHSRLFITFHVPLISLPSLLSTSSMVSGKPPHPLRTSLVV